MSQQNTAGSGPVTLVVGATGNLGGRVVKALLARNKRVRALVRQGTDPSRLEAQGVEIVRGDMLDPASLDRAMEGVSALVTTAIGYIPRRRGDSLATVDDLGNRNLVDAARAAKVGRFVFTSILTCDLARDVPHFWQKKVIEDYIEASGVPFVSLRPGAFIGAFDLWSRGLKKGRITSIGSATARWTYIHIDDVARCLALAVDEPRAVGRRIDLGADRPVSTQEIAALFSRLLGRDTKVRTIPWPLVSGAAGLIGLVNPMIRDVRAMLEYFFTGKYVADTAVQAELFGEVPTIEDSLRRYLKAAGFTLSS